MPNKLPESAWEQMRQLFFQGLSLRQIAARTGTPAGTVAARSSRERWSAQRMQLAAVKQESSPDDKEGMIRAIVLENKLKTLEAESRSARLQAEKALAKIEAGIDIHDLDDIELTQRYRERIWPAVDPRMTIISTGKNQLPTADTPYGFTTLMSSLTRLTMRTKSRRTVSHRRQPKDHPLTCTFWKAKQTIHHPLHNRSSKAQATKSNRAGCNRRL
jgi:hypothetical protein